MKKNFLILFLLIFSSQVFSQEQKAYNQKWLGLFRYQESFTGKYKSEVDEASFFLTANGKTNPVAEYEASLKELFSSEVLSEKHFACRFPARSLIISQLEKKSLPFNLLGCEKYKEYIEKVNLHSVSLVFSSYYIQNPASAFGHTFLRLRSKDSIKEDNDLLDYGVDYSAQVTTSNPILYGIYGVFGGFFGQFKMMPYYYKVREYNDSESRDLWDYEINFTEEDSELFMAHLFEMESARFDYYYFTENCSYHVLAIIAAIRPDWELMKNLDSFLPPVQTIYALFDQENIVRKIKYSPSVYKKAYSRFETLNTNQRKEFFALVANEKTLESVADVDVVDTYSEYIDYKYSKDLESRSGKNFEAANDLKFDANLRRSQLQGETKSIDYSKEYLTSPEKGHNTKRIKLGVNREDSKVGFEFEYRFSFHDGLDPVEGFIPYSSTEMGRLRFSYNERYDFKLKEFTVVSVDAMRPINDYNKSLSWRFSFGLRDDEEIKKQRIDPFIYFSYGPSTQIKSFLAGAFLATEQEMRFDRNKKYRLAFGPEFLLMHHNSFFSLSFTYKRLKEVDQELRYSSHYKGEMRYFINQRWSSYFTYDYQDGEAEKFALGQIYYF